VFTVFGLDPFSPAGSAVSAAGGPAAAAGDPRAAAGDPGAAADGSLWVAAGSTARGLSVNTGLNRYLTLSGSSGDAGGDCSARWSLR